MMFEPDALVWFNRNGFTKAQDTIGVVIGESFTPNHYFISHNESWYQRTSSEIRLLTDEEVMLWKLEGNDVRKRNTGW